MGYQEQAHQLRQRSLTTLDRLIAQKQHETWPTPSISDARRAVYQDILEGFRTLPQAREYIQDIPRDNVIFTARGDEIPFDLIAIVIADIERNPWLSPFETGTAIQPSSRPISPQIDRYFPGRAIRWQSQVGRRAHIA